jgi:hypothetical protein
LIREFTRPAYEILEQKYAIRPPDAEPVAEYANRKFVLATDYSGWWAYSSKFDKDPGVLLLTLPKIKSESPYYRWRAKVVDSVAELNSLTPRTRVLPKRVRAVPAEGGKWRKRRCWVRVPVTMLGVGQVPTWWLLRSAWS